MTLKVCYVYHLFQFYTYKLFKDILCCCGIMCCSGPRTSTRCSWCRSERLCATARFMVILWYDMCTAVSQTRMRRSLVATYYPFSGIWFKRSISGFISLRLLKSYFRTLIKAGLGNDQKSNSRRGPQSKSLYEWSCCMQSISSHVLESREFLNSHVGVSKHRQLSAKQPSFHTSLAFETRFARYSGDLDKAVVIHEESRQDLIKRHWYGVRVL